MTHGAAQARKLQAANERHAESKFLLSDIMSDKMKKKNRRKNRKTLKEKVKQRYAEIRASSERRARRVQVPPDIMSDGRKFASGHIQPKQGMYAFPTGWGRMGEGGGTTRKVQAKIVRKVAHCGPLIVFILMNMRICLIHILYKVYISLK